MRTRSSGWRLIWGAVVAVGLAGVFVACGSSGGGGAEPPTVLDIGMQSATVPSTVVRSLLNPLGGAATVTAEAATGVLAFDPAAFPREVPASGSFSVPVHFAPTGPGPQTSLQTLVFQSGGGVARRTFELRATGEPLGWQATPEPADFGFVLPGEERLLTIEVTNTSSNSPVTLTGGATPLAGIEFVGTPFPLACLPGVPVEVELRFAPAERRDYSGPLRLGSFDDPGGPFFVPLVARGTGAGEQVVNFGSQGVIGGFTNVLEVEVPDDAVSLTVEAVGQTNDVLGLGILEGPGGEVYENTGGTGPHPWLEARGAFGTHLPSGDAPANRLVAGGGTYRFSMQLLSGTSSSLEVRAIIERRPNGTESQSILPLNIYWAAGLSQTAATAATDDTWQAVLFGLQQILAARGITVGDVTHYDITDPTLDNPLQVDTPVLFAKSSMASATRLNLFFVRTVQFAQLVGLSGAIGGPRLNGRASTGVVVGMEGLGTGAIAQVVAHEACHYLGLWHTVDGDGSLDVLGDTPACPVSGTSAACPTAGGGLLMHWQALGGTTLSLTQGQIARRHALMDPSPQDLVAKPTLRPPAPTLSAETLEDLRAFGPGWCGTCRTHAKRR